MHRMGLRLMGRKYHDGPRLAGGIVDLGARTMNDYIILFTILTSLQFLVNVLP